MMFAYYVHSSKYIKYNSPYKVKHHRDIVQCCKANFKSNLSRLETKKEEHCLHLFKYINCKEDYQADINVCYYWKHCFNKEQYAKKYQELHENRSKSIYSAVDKESI